MNIIEHDDNIVTKQASNIQRYLLRIIQRYFDMCNVESRNSIEAIVVEALNRIKKEYTVDGSFLFSINGKTGNVTLTAQDIEAEHSFKKNTAFNKNFASPGSKTPDTICQGNDPRLSDKRTPKPHHHSDYTKLKNKSGKTLGELLEECKIPEDESSHYHINYDSVLNRLKYTGDKDKIDLAYVRLVKQAMTERLDEIDSIRKGLEGQVNIALSGLDAAREKSNGYLIYSRDLLKTPPTWYDEAMQYIDATIQDFRNKHKGKVDSIVNQEQYQEFLQGLGRYLHLYTPSLNEISLNDTTSPTVPVTLDTGGLDIQRVDAFLKYEETDGSIINIPLPYIFKEIDGTAIIVRCFWKRNEIYYDFSPFNICDYYKNAKLWCNVYIGLGD